MDPTEKIVRQLNAGKVFTPTTPVDESNLFSGRASQLQRIVETVTQRGQHAIIFGERGVGKTSLANVIAQLLTSRGAQAIAPRANADSGDTFTSLWRKAFSEITITQEKEGTGFTAEKTFFQQTVADKLPAELSPDLVRRALAQLASGRLLIVIIDEFDRVARPVATAVADTIKMLSDQAVDATVVLVGVADSVDQLIQEHASVERALVQIPMPRMSPDEIREIITRGLGRLTMRITGQALERIVLLAQGLPHYAHLLGLYTTLKAIDETADEITLSYVEAAISKAVENAQMSIRTAYSRATSSPRAENLYGQVLLACAMTSTDDLGYFTPAAVRDPMSALMGRYYDIPSFSRHLYDFTEDERGPVLERIGTERKYRYRFKNPLLQPYIIMRGLADGLLDEEKLKSLTKE
jgi:energy-coupling factor transporter ATP-binding protein EcfA2